MKKHNIKNNTKKRHYSDNRKVDNLKVNINKSKVNINKINDEGIFVFSELMSPLVFAKKINRYPQEIVKFFFMKGKQITLNTQLTADEIGEYCLECNLDFRWEKKIDETNFLEEIINQSKDNLTDKRPPIITIMGHVDHGKTTLLDKIRKTNTVSSEFGGITQKIGAYMVSHNGSHITFIDTPGHESFTKMRANGVNITDIVILVVAADDGVKPQTKEAIDHAKAANVPIIVFVNKIDKENANYDLVISQLSDCGVVAEEWGGDAPVVKGSALSGDGIDTLLETIILVSEIKDYRAANDVLANGVVLESYIDKGLGPIANIIVKNGLLYKNDFIVVGNYYGKIRKIINDKLQEVDVAYPSHPVSVCGINGVPNSGDKFIITKNEKIAKELIAKRVNFSKKNTDNKLISSTNQPGDNKSDIKIINVILKTDYDGSLNAILDLLDNISVSGAKLSIVRAAIGDVSESDISLAKASNAIVFGFNININNYVNDFAKSNNINIKIYNVIYHLKDELEMLLKGSIDPIYEEQETAKAEVRELWFHSSVGQIIGCHVLEGEMSRNNYVRVMRNKEVIINKTRIISMKFGKNNINTVKTNNECGIVLDTTVDIQKDDIIISYKMVKKDIFNKG